MKTKLFTVFFFLFILSSSSQTWQWAQRGGGSGSEKGNDIAIDNNGNSYLAGYYNTGQPSSYTATFGIVVPPVYASGWGKEGFVAKIDKYGNWQWVNSILGGYDERVLGVCVDKINGFVYAAGTFWDWGGTNAIEMQRVPIAGVCALNTTSSGGSDNIFVAKMDLNGSCQWITTVGGSNGDDHGFDVVTDNQGNVYLTGFISSTSGPNPVAFGTTTVTAPMGDSLAFVAKMLPSGIFQWVQTFGNCDGERDNRIAIDNSNNVYVAGGFHGTKTFGTTTLTSMNNSVDVFVVKYDQFGNFQWVKSGGGLFDDRANGIAFDDVINKIYITGEFRDYAYFGLDTINNNGGPNGRDIFVAKMNASTGNWNWAKKAGSKAGGERGNGICLNNKGNIFITGEFCDTAKFGPIVTLISAPTTSVDAFVAAIDSLGKWHWALRGGTSNEDRGSGIAVDDSCNLYNGGWYEGVATFGSTTLTQVGKKESYAARIINACFNYVLNFDELFTEDASPVLFPNPAQNTIHLKINPASFDPEKTGISIWNILGQEINVIRRNEENEISIDISDLSSGIYFVNLNSEGKTKAIKFIKQ
jgi:hypothetical protein